ncbi:CHAD domain-containing protein [Cellulomonas sp. McL0617]|uniref:CHAD domain-containing protein n=1 Tax=Cellulomonas sp. McL0617 TaxID=3415675 RepID=UPI003CE7F7A1
MGNDDAIVRAYLVHHTEALIATEPGLRSGDVDAVHDARTATRRLRTALSVHGVGAEPLRAALRDLGHALGAARDPVVELHALRRTIATEPPELVRGPVVLRIEEDLTAAEQTGLDALGSWLGSSWADLTASLAAPDPDVADVRTGALRAWRRLDRAVDALDAAPDEERDEALHEVRKAARRARYASEVAAESVGRPALKSAKRARAVQETLGDQHDAVVRRETLRRLSLQAFADGEDTFTYGLLHAAAQRAGDQAEHAARPLVERAISPRHRRWTR